MINVLASMEDVLKDISEFVNGCLGPLGGNGATAQDWLNYLSDFLVQLCATIILFLVVKFFLWKPITKLLEERRIAIDNELASAKEHEAKAMELEEALKDKYEKSKIEIQELINNAVKEGNSRKEEIIKEAKIEAERRIKASEAEIALEISKQEQNIKNQIVEVAFLAAEKIVGKEVDRNKYLATVNKIIDSGIENE